MSVGFAVHIYAHYAVLLILVRNKFLFSVFIFKNKIIAFVVLCNGCELPRELLRLDCLEGI